MATETNERLVQPPQQILEHAVGFIRFWWASNKSAAKRRGNSGLVGQAFDADDAPFHLVPGRLLLRVASH